MSDPNKLSIEPSPSLIPDGTDISAKDRGTYGTDDYLPGQGPNALEAYKRALEGIGSNNKLLRLSQP
jgi:hypothetical protein